jgi:hypothetical protein
LVEGNGSARPRPQVAADAAPGKRTQVEQSYGNAAPASDQSAEVEGLLARHVLQGPERADGLAAGGLERELPDVGGAEVHARDGDVLVGNAIAEARIAQKSLPPPPPAPGSGSGSGSR